MRVSSWRAVSLVAAGVLGSASLVLTGPASAGAGGGSGAGPGDGLVKVIVVTAPSGGGQDAEHRARSQARRQVEALNGELGSVWSTVLDGYSASVPADSLDELRDEPNVVRVELDQIGRGLGTQDPVPSWGLDRIDQRALPLSGGYSYGTTGADVDAYIFDSGLRLTHQEFTGRVRAGPDFVDDDADPTDCHGHGTHVAGTVGGTSYGVAKGVRVVPVRVLNCENWGFYSDWIDAAEWITEDHQAGVPAVVNASVGGGFSQAVNNAVTASVADGIVWAVAAGNDNVDACNVTPASAAGVVTVGATASDDDRAAFSNWGPCVELFGPGVSITSAWIGSDSQANTISGTSMATPHVTGAAARYLQGHRDATPAGVSAALLGAATTGVVGNPAGSPNRLLYVAPPRRPGPPRITDAVSGRAGGRITATARWLAPRSDGNSLILGYRVRALRFDRAGHVVGSTLSGLLPASSRSVVMVLPWKGKYRFTVKAVNEVGAGPWSARSNAVLGR